MRGFVQSSKAIDGSVGIGRRLEIREKVIDFVAVFEAADAVVELVEDVLTADAAAGAETAVVAKRAAADGDLAIDVGAGKAGVEAHFLHTLVPELLPEKVAIGVVPKTGDKPIGRLDGQQGTDSAAWRRVWERNRYRERHRHVSIRLVDDLAPLV